MHNQDSIQDIIRRSLPQLHKKRVTSLIEMASSLLNGGLLTVSSLGRHLSGTALEKSKIHRADSIIGNGQLSRNALWISKCLVEHFFKNRKALYILIDGSGCCSKERFILQSSIANNGLGRSQPIHSIIYENGPEAHIKGQDLLLKELQFILSEYQGQIVLITDAGFYSSWFNKVREIGWDYVGRVRGRVKIRMEGSKQWQTIQECYTGATNKAITLGKADIGKDNQSRSWVHCFLLKKIRRDGKSRYLKEDTLKKNDNTNKCIKTLGYWFLR